jgi:DNA-binding NarL/FixJ family response regulator
LLEAQPGWKVCGEASNGREAIGKVKELKPDVAIIDIGMPELNGLEATRRIVKLAPRVHVLILTMHDSPEIIERVLASGARGYVLKSDAERDVVAAVEALCEGKPFFTSAISEMMLESFVSKPRWEVKRETAPVRLTQREREIVQLLAEGKSNKEVAAALGISVRTAETHRARIMRKLGCKSFSHLVRFAIRNKIVEP